MRDQSMIRGSLLVAGALWVFLALMVVAAVAIAAVSLSPVSVAGPTPLISLLEAADSPSFAGAGGRTSANPPEPSAEAGASGEGGQAPTAAATGSAATTWTVPRTPDGHPDLQGLWNAATLTPLERPEDAKGKATLTEAEAAAIAKTEQARVERLALPSDPNRSAPPVGGDGSRGAAGNVGGYNNFWIDRGNGAFMLDGQWRTSIIVDPPDGRIPPMLPEAVTRNAAVRFARPTADAPENTGAGAPGAYDNVEQRPLAERCLLGFGSTSGPPTLPNYFYNNMKQIVQTPDYVMILIEMVHDARVIPLNRPHAPKEIRKWMGDSVGHWEGDTLVVDTTNFTDKTRFRGSSENLHVIERFRRVDANTILYQFTVEDQTTWTRAWSGEYPWVAAEPGDHLYEYACHEANYALGDILRGARLLEAEEAAKTVDPAKQK